MYRSIDETMKSSLQGLAEESPGALRFLHSVASRERDRSVTAVRVIAQLADVEYREALDLAKRFASFGCGRYVVGRRGEETRIEWFVPITQMGQAVAGIQLQADDAEPAVRESATKLTIAKAKQLVADAFHTTPESIEITVRI